MKDWSEQKLFISKYSQFVKDGSQQYGQLYWWATWLASRNRFSSALNSTFFQIFRKKTPLEFKTNTQFFKTLIYSIKFSVRLFWSRYYQFGRWKSEQTEIQNKDVYVVKTFAYTKSFHPAEKFEDIFFGNLPSYLKDSRNVEVLTVFDPIGCDMLAAKSQTPRVFSYLVFLNYFDLLKIWMMIFRGLMAARPKDLKFEGVDVSEFTHAQYRADLLSPNGFFTFSIYLAFKKICSQLKVSHVLMTQENNPWERLLTLATREINPRTKILGYQHTVVPQASLNMFPGESEAAIAPSPDMTVTVGSEPARILKTYGYYEDHKITPACGLRFQYLESIVPKVGPKVKKLLVGPEGVPYAIEFLEYVIRELADDSSWKVRFRFHPAMGYEAYRSKLSRDIREIAHFEISEEVHLQQDLEQCGALLYWGSTVALEALKFGLPLINFDRGDLLSYDSLFDYSNKWTVTPDTPLKPILSEIAGILLKNPQSFQAAGIEYMAAYVGPVVPENMDKFL